MKSIQNISIDKLINDSLIKSMSYSDYKNHIVDLVAQNSTTGNDKSESLAEYTKLNSRRMKRWDKTLKISEEVEKIIQKVDKKITWLVLTESWCGDAAHVIPVFNKIAELNKNINLRLVLRDENEDLMNAHLTDGGQAIPKLIGIEEATGNVIHTYGPRPSLASRMVKEYKENYGKLTPEFKQDLQIWYNKDKGQTTIDDMLDLMKD